MEPGDFVEHVNSESPMTIDLVTVGAAIIRQDKANPQILLLEKNPLELAFETEYELPTGTVESKHPLIMDAVLSMIINKTLLPAHDIKAPLPTYSYTYEKLQKDLLGNPHRNIKRRVMQLSYVVLVDRDMNVMLLDREAHCRSVWADYGRVKELKMTEQVRKLAKEALRFVGVKVEGNEEQNMELDQNKVIEDSNRPGKCTSQWLFTSDFYLD